MNFLTMEYFLSIAEHRNITKAAAELHITQQNPQCTPYGIGKGTGYQIIYQEQSDGTDPCGDCVFEARSYYF